MSNTINVNYMTGMVNSLAKSVSPKTAPSVTFGEMLASTGTQVTDTVAISTAGAAEAVSRDDMTMEEYKKSIFDRISAFPIHPSHPLDQYSIHISDAGFQAMKDDPEYEKWVLDCIKDDMAYPAPSWYVAIGGPPACCILNFGAVKEARSGQMFAVNYGNGQGQKIFDEHADDSFWTNRSKRQKELLEESIKAAEKCHKREQALMEAAVEKSTAYRKAMSQYHSQKNSQRGQSVIPMPQVYFSADVSAAEMLDFLM